MKRRKCPCCQEEISIRYFIKRVLFPKKSISFTENEKGFTCRECNQPIMSAEKRFKLDTFTMSISIIPMAIFGLNDNISFSEEYIIKFISVFVLSFTLFLMGIFRQYYKVNFICNDKSSDAYNQQSIFG